MKIFAVDIESTGQFPDENFATQIGLCCVESTDFDPNCPEKSIISTFSTYLAQPPNSSWEERCVNEFWLKNKDIYDETLLGVKNASDTGVIELLEWIDKHKDANPEQNLLITDNSAFDFVFFSKILENHHRSLLYLFGSYEQTPLDVSSYYLGLSKRNVPATNTWGSFRAACNSMNIEIPKYFASLNLKQHDAGSDATVIALQFLLISSRL